MPKKIVYHVRNWKHYNRSLINRGNLTIWFSEDAVKNWYQKPLVKRQIKYSLWFQEFHSAQRTIAGYESMHMIRKGQVCYVGKNDPISQKRFVQNIF